MAEKSGNKVLLAFSGGKDAIAAWIALRKYGVKVFPYYYYIHPGLEFVNSSLAYYEEMFGERIMRVPNPKLYECWRECVDQTPERLATLLGGSIPKFDSHDLAQAVKQTCGLPANTYTALGVRAADSVNRRTMFVRSGPIFEKRFKFYPVWDWTKSAVRIEIFRAKLKLPVDYWIFGRSFDGLDYRFIAPIAKHYPDDYERLKQFFPMLDAELKRAEFAGMTDHL